MAFDELIEYLGDILKHHLSGGLFSLQQLYILLEGIVTFIINVFVSLYNSFIGLISNVSSSLTTFFTGLLPSVIIGLIVLGIAITVIQRIYFYLKDVSILGFKI